MEYSEFCYVDYAVDGAVTRNHIIKISDLDIPSNVSNIYVTMFRFKREYKELVDTTGSVRGASQFECWSDYLWFDIDASNLDDATANMQTLLRGIESMGVLEHTVVFFSGSKGYHVGINSGVFGFEPSQELPDIMRLVCEKLSTLFHVEIDTKIYNHNRLWRVVNTLHAKTGLYKTELTPRAAISLETSTIKGLAADPAGRDFRSYTTAHTASPVDRLVRLVSEVCKAIKKTDGWAAPPIYGERSRVIAASLDYLLLQGVTKGDRDNEALLRASECRKIGNTDEQCLARMLEWNTLNEPTMSMSDLKRVVRSAYTGDGYDFGTNNDSLREARETVSESPDKLDIDAILRGDVNSEEEKYEKRPRSIAELLAGNGRPKELETVGEYFSWRKRITLLVGREKASGKSTFCTFEAMSVLRKGLRVLWISPDEPRDDVVYRLMKAGVEKYAEQCIIASDMDMPSTWKELVGYIVDTEPDLVILDSIHSIIPIVNNGKVPDNSEGAEWQRLLALLRPLATKLGLAIVWLHHANKASGVSTGSIGITAAVDVIVHLQTAHKPNRRILSFMGRRINASNNFAVDYLGETKGYERVTDWEDEAQNKYDKKSKNELVLEWLTQFVAEWKDETFSKTEVAETYRQHFHENPDDGSALTKALAELRKVNIIGSEPRKIGKTSIYTVTRNMNDTTKPSDLTGDDNDDV